MTNHIINIPRNEMVELVQKGVQTSERSLSSFDADLLVQQAEQAPYLAFGVTMIEHEGKSCVCPAARAGLTPRWNSFADAFDKAVQAKYDLSWSDYGVLVIS